MAARQILRREHFGGIFRNMVVRNFEFLTPLEYERKRQALIDAQGSGDLNVLFFDATQEGYPLLGNAASSPLDLHLELTKRCNCACTHCFVDSVASQSETDEMTLTEITSVIRQLARVGGMYVRLTGGEPTIRDDFFDIVDVIVGEGLVVGLNTNGMFGKETLAGILSRDVKDIRISLDGPPEINDRIRTQGSYRKVLGTLENIAQHNQATERPVDVTINVVLMRSNQDHIEPMVELAAKLGFRVSFGLLRLAGRARMGEMLSPEEVVAASCRIHQARARLGLHPGRVRANYDIFGPPRDSSRDGPFPFDNSKCPIGTTGCTIDARGRIVPCGYMVNMDDWVGQDVRGKDLLDLWHHSPVLARARQVRRHSCAGCRYHIVQCNGGCPVMAYLDGDVDGRDPYCVRDVALGDIEMDCG
jgi:radical SAM protein with 4Fe4S-binding SPASM domain